MSEPGSSPWTRSLLLDALGHADTLSESPPTTWPSAATKYEEWSSAETRIEQLERRVAALEHQLVDEQKYGKHMSLSQPMFTEEAELAFAERPKAFNAPEHSSASKPVYVPMTPSVSQPIASSLPAGASRPARAPRPMTPDEFNPFFDVDTTNWSMYGVDAFPEAVVYHHRRPDANHDAEASDQWPKLSKSEISSTHKTHISVSEVKQGSANQLGPSETQLENQNVLEWATDQIRELLQHSKPEPCIALQQQLRFADKACWVIQAISQSIYALSMHELGRFVVHRAICLDASVAHLLVGYIAKLATSCNGTLVLQRIFQLKEMRTNVLSEMLHAPFVPTILSAAALPIWRRILQTRWPDHSRVCIMQTFQTQLRSQWTRVAMSDVGSVVIQECFQAKLLKEDSPGIAELVVHCIECLCDQYGVWVIQCLVEHGDEMLQRQILRQILKHAAAVCLSPYGAKAVQVILRFSAEHVSVQLIDRLCEPRWHFRHASRPLLIDVALTQQGLPLIAQVCLWMLI